MATDHLAQIAFEDLATADPHAQLARVRQEAPIAQVQTPHEGDQLLAPDPLTFESYAAYAVMNDRFHALLLEASGNRALQRAVALNDKLPFAPASAMLPMQSSLKQDREWMHYAHRQHHMLFDALQRGEGARAQALAMEHTEVAQMNMRLALERRSETERVMPAMRLVVGR